MKAIAKAILPEKLRRFVKSVVSPSYRDRLEWEEDRRRGQVVFAATGGEVVAGPFKGLRYVSTARGSSIGPKLLGTYELELRPAVEAIAARAYPVIINIGAGEGYYSVGLAKRMPGSRIISFDAEPYNQEQLKTLAELNAVAARIEIRGFCDDAALSAAIGDNTDVLVVCDIEGAEVEVLDPAKVPALLRADMLVEMHDIIRKGCSPALRARFEKTHDIEVISSRDRRRKDFPAAVSLDDREKLACMDEGRGAVMDFFWMRRKPLAN